MSLLFLINMQINFSFFIVPSLPAYEPEKLLIADFELRISDCEFRIEDCGLSISD